MPKFIQVRFAGRDFQVAVEYVAFVYEGNPKKPGKVTRIGHVNGIFSQIEEPLSDLWSRIQAKGVDLQWFQFTDEQGNPGYVQPRYITGIEKGPKDRAFIRCFGPKLDMIPTGHSVDELVHLLESV